MAKRKLTFLQVTQDGEIEGVFKLDRLPTEEEAALIREVLGIRRRPNVSEQSLQNLREPRPKGSLHPQARFFEPEAGGLASSGTQNAKLKLGPLRVG